MNDRLFSGFKDLHLLAGPTLSRAMMNADASYVCGACGEEIVIPIDISQGDRQKFVEDCPVCCQANVIVVEVDSDGEARAWAELE